VKNLLPYTFILFGISVLVVSCNSSDKFKSMPVAKNSKAALAYTEIEKAEWLLGNWEHGSSAEHWEKENDSIYIAQKIQIIDSDTIKSEAARIEQHGHKLYYIPVSENKSSDKPVKFALTSSDDHELIFENTTKDFPQKIKYHQLRKDSLDTWILGTVDGKLKSKMLPMSLAK
jgi:hypothetical protein